jgi:hypothetical protein
MYPRHFFNWFLIVTLDLLNQLYQNIPELTEHEYLHVNHSNFQHRVSPQSVFSRPPQLHYSNYVPLCTEIILLAEFNTFEKSNFIGCANLSQHPHTYVNGHLGWLYPLHYVFQMLKSRIPLQNNELQNCHYFNSFQMSCPAKAFEC